MKIRLLRLLFLLLGLAALGGFGLTFQDFLENKAAYMRPFDIAGFEKTLHADGGVKEVGHLGDWSRDYRLIHQLNLTGEIRVDPVATAQQAPPPPPPVGADDLEVTYIQMLGAVGCAFIRPKVAVQRPDDGRIPGDLYCVGDQFEIESKPGIEVRVDAIRQTEVDLSVLGRDLTFTLTTASYTVDPSAILVGGKGGSVQARILPKQTRMVEPNRWELGTEDVTAMGAMSEEEVLSAVQVRPKRDQETGAIRGLQVSRLQENSVLARQGIREQDIILDVNGFPATDRGRLLEHMRRQGDSSSVTVTLERAGSVRTYTYRVPRR